MKISDRYIFSHPSEAAAVLKALEQSSLSGTSETVQGYEQSLANLFRTKHAIATSSGSGALHCAMRVLGVTPGSKVIVSAAAPIPTLLPILTIGAIPLFVDTDPDTFAFDLTDLSRAAKEPSVSACISVQLWGYPCLSKEALKLLSDSNIPLIEDAAHAHLTTEASGLAGTIGAIGCFSTHDRKLLATGEGGFCLTNDDALANQLQSVSTLGLLDGVHHGYKYKLSALQAALGTVRLQYLPWQLERRSQNAKTLMALISNQPSVSELKIADGAKPNYYNLAIRLKAASEVKVREFIQEMDRLGIPSNILRYDAKAGYAYPLFAPWARVCPNAEALLASVTTFPVHPAITPAEIEYMAQVISSIVS